MVTTLAKIEKKNSTNGDEFVRVQAGRQWYSCWKPELFDVLFEAYNERKQVELGVQTSKDGKFKNIVDAELVGGQENQQENRIQQYVKEKRENIAKHVALYCATDIHKTLLEKSDKKALTNEEIAQFTTDLAQRFFQWLTNNGNEENQ